jgi:protein-S-isoprenylcysteine O-methyltransferase Ste14
MSFEASAIANLTAWLLYIATFVVLLSTRERAERRRDMKMLLGLSFQAVGTWIIPFYLRPFGSPLFPVGSAQRELEQVVRLTALLLEFGAVWLTVSAIRTLGRQWSISARVVEGHRLVRSGPYSLVRHPIYAAVLSINAATALTFARWEALVASLAFSVLGGWIRARAEEHLLREAFGPEYASYARAVPALVPGLRLWRSGSRSP